MEKTMEILDDGADLTSKQAAEFLENSEKETVEKTSDNAPEGTLLTPEQFEQHFIEIFDICGDLWNMPEFKVQRDKPFEIAGAKVSAAKLYMMAQKYTMMHFLIEPCGGWFGDMIAISCFVGAKANIACKRFTGNGLRGYFHRFMKKSSEQVKTNSFMSKFFNKGGKYEEKNNG